MDPEVSLLLSQTPFHFSILSHINPIHTLQNNFFKIHFNTILTSMSWSSKSDEPYVNAMYEELLQRHWM
jgi:hypothetical protein